MSARIDFKAMGQEAAARIKERRDMRAFKLFEIRCELREMGRNGGLNESELFDLVCTLGASAAAHLNEAKESLSDLACDLEGLVYGDRING